MPARHWTAGGLLSEAEQVRSFDRRRGCRRDIRSTAGSAFQEALALPEIGSGRRNGFSSHGADRFMSAVSLRATLAGVRSGPDVFADALVPRPERAVSGTPFPKTLLFDCRGPPCPQSRARARAMVILLRRPQGKPSPASATKPCRTTAFRMSCAAAAFRRLHPVHRDA